MLYAIFGILFLCYGKTISQNYIVRDFEGNEANMTLNIPSNTIIEDIDIYECHERQTLIKNVKKIINNTELILSFQQKDCDIINECCISIARELAYKITMRRFKEVTITVDYLKSKEVLLDICGSFSLNEITKTLIIHPTKLNNSYYRQTNYEKIKINLIVLRVLEIEEIKNNILYHHLIMPFKRMVCHSNDSLDFQITMDGRFLIINGTFNLRTSFNVTCVKRSQYILYNFIKKGLKKSDASRCKFGEYRKWRKNPDVKPCTGCKKSQGHHITSNALKYRNIQEKICMKDSSKTRISGNIDQLVYAHCHQPEVNLVYCWRRPRQAKVLYYKLEEDSESLTVSNTTLMGIVTDLRDENEFISAKFHKQLGYGILCSGAVITDMDEKCLVGYLGFGQTDESDIGYMLLDNYHLEEKDIKNNFYFINK